MLIRPRNYFSNFMNGNEQWKMVLVVVYVGCEHTDDVACLSSYSQLFYTLLSHGCVLLGFTFIEWASNITIVYRFTPRDWTCFVLGAQCTRSHAHTNTYTDACALICVKRLSRSTTSARATQTEKINMISCWNSSYLVCAPVHVTQIRR